jgi:hypothetical protein
MTMVGQKDSRIADLKKTCMPKDESKNYIVLLVE